MTRARAARSLSARGRFTAEDSLVGVLDPTRAHFGHLFENDTVAAGDVVRTGVGAGQAGQAGQYVRWRGLARVDAWPQPVDVAGTDGTNFGFWLNDGACAPRARAHGACCARASARVTLTALGGAVRVCVCAARACAGANVTVWEDDLERPLTLRNAPGDGAEHLGVQLLNFRVEDADMEPDARFNQRLSGFWNLSAVKQGCPVLVSRPRFFGANESWRARLHGVVSAARPCAHCTPSCAARRVGRVCVH